MQTLIFNAVENQKNNASSNVTSERLFFTDIYWTKVSHFFSFFQPGFFSLDFLSSSPNLCWLSVIGCARYDWPGFSVLPIHHFAFFLRLSRVQAAHNPAILFEFKSSIARVCSRPPAGRGQSGRNPKDLCRVPRPHRQFIAGFAIWHARDLCSSQKNRFMFVVFVQLHTHNLHVRVHQCLWLFLFYWSTYPPRKTGSR